MSIPSLQDTSGGLSHTARVRWMLVAAAAVAIALRFLPAGEYLTYPIRLFVTYIHEGSHAVMTILTGGSAESIVVNADGSGVTLSRGGAALLISMAGYLGATLFGGGMLLLTKRPGSGRRTLLLMAGVVLLVTGLWVHPWPLAGAFGFISGLAIAGLLWLGWRYLRGDAADFTAAFLAVQCCVNALLDLSNLVYLSAHTRVQSDAANMQAYTGIPAIVWAVFWGLLGLLLLAATLRAYWRAVPTRTSTR